MKPLMSFFSYLFHPIVIPLFTVLLYFKLYYLYFENFEIAVLLWQVGIMTILIPITLYLFLRSLGLVNSSVMLSSLKQRLIPFSINIILLLVLQKFVLYNSSAYALNLYFNGLIISYCLLLTGAIFKQKFSTHSALLSGCVLFYIFLQLNNQSSDIATLIILILLAGITLSSRLYLNAHNSQEIIAGLFIGVVPQLFICIDFTSFF